MQLNTQSFVGDVIWLDLRPAVDDETLRINKLCKWLEHPSVHSKPIFAIVPYHHKDRWLPRQRKNWGKLRQAWQCKEVVHCSCQHHYSTHSGMIIYHSNSSLHQSQCKHKWNTDCLDPARHLDLVSEIANDVIGGAVAHHHLGCMEPSSVATGSVPPSGSTYSSKGDCSRNFGNLTHGQGERFVSTDPSDHGAQQSPDSIHSIQLNNSSTLFIRTESTPVGSVEIPLEEVPQGSTTDSHCDHPIHTRDGRHTARNYYPQITTIAD